MTLICLQCRRHRKPASIPGSGRSPGEGKWQLISVFSVLENPMNQGAFVGYSLSQELDMTEQFFTHKLIIYSCGPYMK